MHLIRADEHALFISATLLTWLSERRKFLVQHFDASNRYSCSLTNSPRSHKKKRGSDCTQTANRKPGGQGESFLFKADPGSLHHRHRTTISIKNINIPPKKKKTASRGGKWIAVWKKNKIYGSSKQKETFQEFFSLFFRFPRIQLNGKQFHFSDLINKAPAPNARGKLAH